MYCLRVLLFGWGCGDFVLWCFDVRSDVIGGYRGCVILGFSFVGVGEGWGVGFLSL